MTARSSVVVLVACVLLAGCANKQILRSQAVMTKKLGAAATGLEQLAATSVYDRRMAELMAYTPPEGKELEDFLTFVCGRDPVGLSVGHSLSVYRRSLAELDTLAQAPSDGSFAALAASMKKSNKARKDLPDDPADKPEAMRKAREAAEALAERTERRCKAIVRHDLLAPDSRVGSLSSAKYSTLIQMLRFALSLSEQTMRANVVRDYTDKVVRPDLQAAYLYLAAKPDSAAPDALLEAGNFTDSITPAACAARVDFMDPEKAIGPEDKDGEIGFGEAHGQLALLVAQSRRNAIRQGYVHRAMALRLKAPDPSLPANPVLDASRQDVILRSATAAADALARADGLIGVDADCDVLPKLHTSQQQLITAVVEGTGTADLADGFADALDNLQSILDALEKAKKAGW